MTHPVCNFCRVESSFFVKIINKEYNMFLQPPQNNQNSTTSLSSKKRDCLKVMITSGSSTVEDHAAIQHTDTNIGKLRERTKFKDDVVIDLPLSYDDFIQVRIISSKEILLRLSGIIFISVYFHFGLMIRKLRLLLLERSQYFQNTKHSGTFKEETGVCKFDKSFVSIFYISR